MARFERGFSFPEADSVTITPCHEVPKYLSDFSTTDTGFSQVQHPDWKSYWVSSFVPEY
jgi:hypothetical protein